MAISTTEKLRRFYSQFSGGDHVLVLINADPDAMASAMAVKRLLWRKVASVTICHINVMKRPDNVAMARLLSINMVHVDDLKENGRFAKTVLVDSQPPHNEIFMRFKIDVVIDHHPKTDLNVPFMDIRPDYGANASILTEYLRAAKIKPSVKLATGLFHAIKTDTRNFERQTLIEDIRAFQFLFKHANTTLARSIEQSDLRIDFLKYFKRGIETMRMSRGRVFVHLGQVINPDVCVLVADFFMRVNPVTWSIVSGIFQDTLVIVFRNDGIRKNAGRLANRSFCQFGSAGGHKSMARAEIAKTALTGQVDAEDDRAVLKWIMAQIEKKHPLPQSCRKKNGGPAGYDAEEM